MKLSGEGYNREKNNVFLDESNNYFGPITANGNVTQGTLNPYSTNCSWFFDGTGDYLTIPANTVLNVFGGSFTIETWINPVSFDVNSYNYILVQDDGGSNSQNFALRISSTGAPNFVYFTTSNRANAIVLTSSALLQLNTWSHLAVVYNSATTTVTLYLNGNAVASSANAPWAGANIQTCIGNFSSGANQTATYSKLNAYLSNLRMVKGTALYTSNFTPSTSVLTAISGTSLLTCQNTYLVDNSPNSFALTINGDAQSRHYGPFDVPTTTEITKLPARSVFFDGNGDYLSLSSNAAFSMGTGDFTWEAWIYPTSWSNNVHAVYATTATGGLFVGKVNSDFVIRAYGVDNQIAYNVLPTLNVWTHIAAVRSGNSLRLFYNGVQVATATNSYSFAQAAVRIGADDGGATYTGYISNLRLVKGTAVYTSAFTPSTSELTAISNTSLLTCQGAAMTDSSTNAFTITTVGDARVTANSPFSLTSTTTTITPVTQSWSGYFDGNGDYLTTPTNAAFQFGTGDFTIECWINKPAAGNNPIIDARGAASASPYAFYVDASNFPYFYDGTIYASSIAITNNQWNHIAVVRISGTLKIFVNGVQGYSAVLTVALNPSATVYIGGQNFSTSAYTNGYISNLRVVKGTAVYTSNFTPPTSALTAISGTSLLTCQSSRFIDNSINNASITVSADAKTTMFGPFLTTGSMSFNGTNSFLSVPASDSLAPLTGDFTYECWAYPTSATVSYRMIFGIDNYAAEQPFRLYQYGTNFQFWYTGTAGNFINSNTITINQWYHLAVTRSGTSIRFFVNGTQVGSTLTSSANYPSSIFRVGRDSGSLYPFIGHILNVRVVKGTAVYTSNFTPPTTDLTNISNTGLLILGENNFNDSSSNNLVVTNSNASIHTNNNGLPLSPYASNYSVFLSSNAYLVAPSGASTFGTGDFTIECWIYPTTVAATQMIASTATGNTDNNYWAVSLQTDRTIEVQIRDTASQAFANTLSTVNLNSWTHVAVVRNSGNVIIYTNGIPGAVTSITKTVTARTTNIGSSQYTGFQSYFNGYISNLRIVTGTAVYRSSFTPPTSPLTAISGTTLLTCQSNRFIDNSSNAYAITTSGSPAINNSFDPFDGLYSWYFDGTGDYVAVNHSSAINILSGNFTVECWFNSEVASGIRPLMAQWNQASGSEGWILRLESNNTVTFFHAGATPGLTATLTSSSAVNMGTWNHVAVTRNGSALTMWLNGVSVATATSSTTKAYLSINTTFGTYFTSAGAVPATSTVLYKGWISNARILKGVSLYNSAFTPSTAPLITTPNTGLLVAQSNTMDDISGNSLNITRFGDTRVDPFTPFSNTVSVTNTTTAGALLGGTAYFDGTGDFLSVPANDAFIPVANEDFTIDFWWRPTSIASVMAVLSSGWGTITYGAFVVYFDNTNSRLVLYASSANAAWDIANAAIIASNVKPNVWYHIAISRRAGSLRLFSNGVLTTTIASSTAGMYRSVLYPMLVGAGPGGVNPLNGYISNLRILRGAGLYSNSFAPPTTPTTTLASSALTLNFRNAGIYDGIGDNIFETIGDSALSTVQKKNGNSSMYFDGTGDYLTAVNPNLAWGTGDFTVEFWIYSADVSGASQRGQLQTSTTAGGLSTGYTTGVTILQGSNRAFGALTGGLIVIVAGVNVGSNSAVVTTNTWTHVAIARVSGTATLYINGTSVDSRVASGSITATNIAIGGYYSSAYLYSGYLDNLQINSYAKYTANFTPT
jgi:hypothetical protein